MNKKIHGKNYNFSFDTVSNMKSNNLKKKCISLTIPQLLSKNSVNIIYKYAYNCTG